MQLGPFSHKPVAIQEKQQPRFTLLCFSVIYDDKYNASQPASVAWTQFFHNCEKLVCKTYCALGLCLHYCKVSVHGSWVQWRCFNQAALRTQVNYWMEIKWISCCCRKSYFHTHTHTNYIPTVLLQRLSRIYFVVWLHLWRWILCVNG